MNPIDDLATGSGDPDEVRKRILREFAADVLRGLQADPTPPGQLLANHIGRQLAMLASDRYTDWFEDHGERSGFDQAATMAAVAGSDVTKIAYVSKSIQAQFGTTAGRVAELAARDDLRYGRVFASYSPTEDLYMHAEAGRHFTVDELTRRTAGLLGHDAGARAAREAAEGIIGHDSFNSGFGRHVLKKRLAEVHQIVLLLGDSPRPVDKGLYRIESGPYRIQIDSLKAFQTHFPAAAEAVDL